MPDQLFTWEGVLTLYGAAFLVYAIVQYTKWAIDRATQKRIPTDWWAVVVAWGILVAAGAAVGTAVSWQMVVLAFLNAYPVAMTAGHMHDKVKAPPKAGTSPEEGV